MHKILASKMALSSVHLPICDIMISATLLWLIQAIKLPCRRAKSALLKMKNMIIFSGSLHKAYLF